MPMCEFAARSAYAVAIFAAREVGMRAAVIAERAMTSVRTKLAAKPRKSFEELGPELAKLASSTMDVASKAVIYALTSGVPAKRAAIYSSTRCFPQ